MKFDINLIIICLTFVTCTYLIMSGIVEAIVAKNANDLMNENFDEISKLIEKDIEERKKK